MALTNNYPDLDGFHLKPVVLTAAATNSASNSIPPKAKVAVVTAVANDANDWITLPAIADVPIGHKITIIAGASSNFELRTPASSNTKINDVDSDGSQEYLVTDTHTVEVTKISSTAWIGVSYTKLGAVVTAVIPD